MNSTKLASIGLAAALTAVLTAVSAQAQSPRTFVSAAGNDANPCSFAAPCRHFQAAVNATSLGGEVDALDPAGYGPITISQAITIEGQGWSYIAPPASGSGITINAVSGNVTIRGVSLNGVGITGTTTGIQFNSGGSLNVRDSVVRNFTGNGIDFAPNALTPGQIYVSNTLASENGMGIIIEPSGSGATKAVLDHVAMENNSTGLEFRAPSLINATVTDSVSSNNATQGIVSNSTGAGTGINVMVRNSTIANNGGTGLDAFGINSIIRVTRSTITGNNSGWLGVSSFGDNDIFGNGSANNAPTFISHE